MRRRPRLKPFSRQQTPTTRPFTAAAVRRMLSNPMYAYGINLLPSERVAEEVVKLNVQLAQQMRETGVTYKLDDLDQWFLELLQQLEDSGVCRRGEPYPPIITKELWLQAQLTTIKKLAIGDEL